MAINNELDANARITEGYADDTALTTDALNLGPVEPSAPPILMAQAEAAPPTTEAPAPASIIVPMDAGFVVRLPADASIDEPRVNGANLEFVQPDGTVLVIPDGALVAFQLFVGTAAIPPTTLAEVFAESDIIQTAAGLQQGGSPDSSGANLLLPIPDIGPGLPWGALLPPTELAFGPLSLIERGAVDTEPTMLLSGLALSVDEEGLRVLQGAPFDGNNGDSYSDGGDASGQDRSDSGTFQVNYQSNAPHNLSAIQLSAPGATWTQLTAVSGILKANDGSWEAEVDFVSEANNVITYQLEFKLLKPSDHPEANTEDDITVDITVIARDIDGDEVSGVVPVTIDDDAPIEGKDGASSYTVDEDDIDTDLPNGSQGTSPNDGPGDGSYTDDPDNNNDGPAFIFGNLVADGAIKFGADGPEDDAGKQAFKFESPNSGNLAAQLAQLGLSSSDDHLTYQIINTPDADGWIILRGVAGANNRVVFELKVRAVDTDGAGTEKVGDFEFRLYDQLDHDAPPFGTKDENFDLHDHIPGFDIDALPFGQILLALDDDGDSKFLGDAFTISVRDDVPELVKGKHETKTVDEDDIATWHKLINAEPGSAGTSPNDGPGDGSYTENPANNGTGPAHVFGSLAYLVEAGADEHLTFSFLDAATVRAELVKLGLTSQDGELSYEIQNGKIVAFVDNDGGTNNFVYDPTEDRRVFELTLNPDGTYNFRLYDQLDHDAPYDDAGDSAQLPGDNDPLADQNTDLEDGLPGNGEVTYINFGKFIKATDHDGDSVILDGAFKIQIRDDIPELVEGKHETKTVDEDDIATWHKLINNEPGSDGTSPNDGPDEDGSYTENPNNNNIGPAHVFGELAYLVKTGADENLTFSFIDADDARDYLLSLGLTSQDKGLSYAIVDGKIIGFVDDDAGTHHTTYDPGADRRVFELTLDAGGNYHFRLYDQLDHDKPYDDAGDNEQFPGDDKPLADQNTDLEDSDDNSDVNYINFGKLIKATDHDGDSVVLDGAFKIQIRDDIPELIEGKHETKLVNEDDISNGQSAGTSPHADGNLDPDAADGDDSHTAGGNAVVTGSLASLVDAGADEPLKFTFIDENALRDKLEDLGLKSKGALLSYDLQDNVLWGFDNDGPNLGVDYNAGTDRPVFKLTLNEDGTYTFELIDQLDHDPFSDSPDGTGVGVGADENTDLQDSIGGDVDSIDFGSIIKATDFDGDSVILENAFKIAIKDDIPQAYLAIKTDDTTVIVDETVAGTQGDEGSGNPSIFANLATFSEIGNDTAMAAQYASDGNLLITTGSTVGADEPGTAVYSLSLKGNEPLATGLTTSGVSASGDPIERPIFLFEETRNGQTYIVGRYDDNVQPNGVIENGDPAAFALYIDPVTGAVHVALYVSIEHPNASNPDDDVPLPDNLISANYTITDFDGDTSVASVDLGHNVIFRDDGPKLGGEHSAVMVDEDDLNNLDLNDANNDGIYGSQGTSPGGPTTVNGAIGAGVVTSGADNPLTFTFDSVSAMRTYLEGLGLTSKGALLSYDLNTAGTIKAFDNDGADVPPLGMSFDTGAATDRLVFTFTLNANGTYTFTLYDQLDHDAPFDDAGDGAGTADQNTDLVDSDPNSDVNYIDFGKIIKATDADGDSVFLTDKVRVTITDDVPTLKAQGKVEVFVDEDELGSDAGDLSTGITDFDGVTDETLISKASILALVNSGADEPHTVTLNAAISGNVVTTGGVNVTSHGVQVKYAFIDGEIIGYADVNNDNLPAGENVVFRITNSGGNFVFDLEDQLDHSNGVSGSDIETLTLELSAAFRVTDFDGDSLVVSGNRVQVVVENDIPAISISTQSMLTVTHDETGGLQNAGASTANVEDNNDNDLAGSSATTFNGSATTVAALFNAIGGIFVDDPHVSSDAASLNAAIGYAKSAGALFGVNVTPGADDPVSAVNWQLIVNSNGPSGLVTTDGKDIYLVQLDATTVVGYYDYNNNGIQLNGSDAIAVALRVDPATGVVYVAQWVSLDHPTEAPGTGSASYDEAVSFDAGIISIQAYVTDEDEDFVGTPPTDLSGKVLFEDDGPRVTGVTNSVSPTNLITNGSFEDLIPNPALDPGEFGVYNSITGWAKGDNTPFELQIGNVGGLDAQSGQIKVELDSDDEDNPGGGNGTFNAPNTNATIQQTVATTVGQTYELTFWYAARPGSAASSGLEVKFGDDTFTIAPNASNPQVWTKYTVNVTAETASTILSFKGLGTQDELGMFLDNVSLNAVTTTLDDEDTTLLGVGIDGGPGDDGNGVSATGKILFDAGADGLKAISFDAGASALKAIYVDAAGVGHQQQITNVWVADGSGGGTLYGTTVPNFPQATPAYKVVVLADGSYTFTLYAPLAHPATDADGLNNGPETSWEDNLLLGLGFKVTDGDNDSATGTLQINVDDDSPQFLTGGVVDGTVGKLGITINGALNLAYGADGRHEVDGLRITAHEDVPGIHESLSTDGLTLTAFIGADNQGTPLYTLTLDPLTGQYTFTQHNTLPNAAYETLTFEVTGRDGDGDKVSNSFDVTLKVDTPFVDPAPFLGLVEEEHLDNFNPSEANNIQGSKGNEDEDEKASLPLTTDADVEAATDFDNTTNTTLITLAIGGGDGAKTFGYENVDGTPVMFAETGTQVYSNGVAVHFVQVVGQPGVLYGVADESGSDDTISGTDRIVFRIDVTDASAGTFTFTLLDQLDHHPYDVPVGGTVEFPIDNAEGIMTIDLAGVFNVDDSDSISTDKHIFQDVKVQVIDDIPIAICDTATATEGRMATVNVVLVIDHSGSMGDDEDPNSKLALAKAAAINLLENSNVDFNKIMVVQFDDVANINTEGAGVYWTSVEDAIAYIQLIGSGDTTHYQNAINAVTGNWGTEPGPVDQTLLYFISDGIPNPTDSGLDGTEQGAWELFLTNKGVDASYAIGIGTDELNPHLTPISWAPGNPGLAPVIIDDAEDLELLLAGSLPGNPFGNVLTNDKVGADEVLTITSVTIGGKTFYSNGTAPTGSFLDGFTLVSANADQVVVKTAIGGQITFNFANNGLNLAGDWDYLAPATGHDATEQEIFTYRIADRDGDGTEAHLKITVEPSAVPTVTIQTAPIVVSETGLPVRGSEPEGSGEAQNPAAGTDDSEITIGSFTIASTDALQSVTINGTTILIANLLTAPPIDTGEGFLDITAFDGTTVTFSYTLKDNVDHTVHPGTDIIPVYATDVNGDASAPVNVVIGIGNDAPDANLDANNANEGSLLTVNATNGVLSNDFSGADNYASAPNGVVGVRLASGDTTTQVVTGLNTDIPGANGVLKLQSDGSYTYLANSQSNGVPDVFVYTIKDSDGQFSTTTLTITPMNVAGGVATVVAALDPAYEDGNSTTAGQAVNDAADTKLQLTFNLKVVPADGGDPVSEATVGGIPAGATASWTVGPNTVTFAPGSNLIDGSDAAELAFLAALKTGGGANIVITLAEHDSTDVMVSFTATVDGGVTNTAADNAVVDSVAADPTLADPANVTVNESNGANTQLVVTVNADFSDLGDGNEVRQILLKAPAGFTLVSVSGNSAAGVANTLPAGFTNAHSDYTAVNVTPNADGTVTLTVTLQAAGSVNADLTGVLNVVARAYDPVTDTDVVLTNNVATAAQTVDLKVVNVHNPLVQSGEGLGLVEEEHGIAGGNEDDLDAAGLDTDETPVTLLNTVTNVTPGSFTVTGGDGVTPPQYSFVSDIEGDAVNTDANGPLTSGGKQVYFHRVDADTLEGYINNGAGTAHDGGDTTVFTLQITDTTAGHYSFTLHTKLDHPTETDGGPATEENIAINLDGTVQVTYAGNPSAPTLLNASITVIDDVPVAEDNTQEVATGSAQTVDLMLVVDMSGSMGPIVAFGGGDVWAGSGQYGTTRVELARYSLDKFLTENPQIQNVQIVKFAQSADTTAVWMTRAQALVYVQTDTNWEIPTTANTGPIGTATWYDAGIAGAITEFSDDLRPLPAGDQTYVYFITDGNPTAGHALTNTTAWDTFIDNNGIDGVFGVGIGDNVLETSIEPVVGDNGDIVIVDDSDTDALSTTLGNLLAPKSITGNVLEDDLNSTTGADSFGADGGYIKSIVIDGVTYEFNGTGTVTPSGAPPAGGQVIDNNGTWIVIKTVLGGLLTFHFADNANGDAGEYTYLAPANATGPQNFQYTLVDGDGDEVSASLNITVVLPPNELPVSTADTVTTNEDASVVLALSDFGTYSDPDSDPIAAVKITSLPPTDGTLQWDSNGLGNWIAVLDEQEIGAAHISANRLRFVPDSNEFGAPYTTIGFKVGDGAGFSAADYVLTVNVNSVNDEPSFTIAGNPAASNEDTGQQTIANFVTAISTGPANESGQTPLFQITANTNVGLFSVAPAIAADGTLTYTAAPNAFGTATITVQLQDNGGTANGGDNTSPTQQFVITVNDAAEPNVAPVLANLVASQDYDEGDSWVRIDSNVGVTDADSLNFDTGSLTVAFTQNGDASDQLRINPGDEIEISGNEVRHNPPGMNNTVTIGTFSGGTNGTALVILFNSNATPAIVDRLIQRIEYENTSQDPTDLNRQVTFTLTDGDGGTEIETTTINVNPVNDLPSSTNDSETTNEDTTLVLDVSDFGTFSDLDDTLTVVRITTLESNGSLEYDTTGLGAWAAVTLNQEITAAHITAGRLQFVPDTNENGSPYTTVGFRVGDGTTFSASAYTLTINVTAVNDGSPVANDDLVHVNVTPGDSSVLVIPEWALLWNDSDPDFGTLDVSAASLPGGSDLASVSLATNAGSVTVTNNTASPGDDTDWGNFNYTLAATGETDPANVIIQIDTTSALDGGASNGGANILIDLDAAATTINGGGGNDVLIGNTGNDFLDGGLDNDLLFGGNGSDDLAGGLGTDRIVTGSGNDNVIYNAPGEIGDFIADFSNTDEIFIESGAGGFNVGGGTGAIGAGLFTTAVTSANAAGDTVDGAVRFVFYDGTGGADPSALYYDSDGGSSANRVLMVTFEDGAAINAADIIKF